MKWHDLMVGVFAKHSGYIMKQCLVEKFMLVPTITEPPEKATVHSHKGCTVWFLAEWVEPLPKTASEGIKTKINLMVGCSKEGEEQE